MFDHPRRTEELLTTLKASVPFVIEIAPSVVEQLRDDGVVFADDARFVVRNVSYAGDEGGIMCHVAHPQSDEAIVISLTYVRMPRRTSLTTAILSYQKHRLKKLKKQVR